MIIILIPSSNNLPQYLLIFSCIYTYDIQPLSLFYNLYTLVPLLSDVSQQPSTATIIVMVLPLVFFIALQLIVHKKTIKTIVTKITSDCKTKQVPITINSIEVLVGDIKQYSSTV